MDESLDYLWRHDPNGRASGTSKAQYARILGITTTLGERHRRKRELPFSVLGIEPDEIASDGHAVIRRSTE